MPGPAPTLAHVRVQLRQSYQLSPGIPDRHVGRHEAVAWFLRGHRSPPWSSEVAGVLLFVCCGSEHILNPPPVEVTE
jgi:hypothetical protein